MPRSLEKLLSKSRRAATCFRRIQEDKNKGRDLLVPAQAVADLVAIQL